MFSGIDSGFMSVHGMKTEHEGPVALDDFVREIGAPFAIRNDNSKMQTGNRWRDILRKYVIAEATTEPHHPQQNPAERRIGELKKYAQKIMDRTGTPSYLWFYCILYVVFLLNRTAMEPLSWRTPIEKALGETPDISSLLQFAFYEPVYYYDPDTPFPDSKEKIGHFIGIAENCGDALTFWILTGKRTVLARSVVRSALVTGEQNKRQDRVVDARLEGSLEDKVSLDLNSDLIGAINVPTFDPVEVLGYQFIRENDRGVPVRMTVKEHDEDIDKYKISTIGEEEDEWVDGTVIQEALLSRKDDAAQEWTISKVLDHRTIGKTMEVYVEWKDGDKSWEPMEVIRKDDPIALASYAKEKDLVYSPGWRWARKLVKNERTFSRMLKLLTGQKRHAPKYKFGIQVPRSRKEALELDKTNGNHFWREAMDAEIQQLLFYETFQILPRGQRDFARKSEYTYIPMHMVFDVKFDLRRKARLVAGGNFTDPPDTDVFSGVVGIENVRLAMFLCELNGLMQCAADIGNAFLHGVTRELIYMVAGPEFGPEIAGRTLIAVKSIYGLKTSAARFHEVLAASLFRLGFKPSKADTDLWMKDCGTHYEYIATYVDDLLVMSKDPMRIIKALEEEYGALKGVGFPKYYLGGDIGRITEGDQKGMLYTSAKTYITRICDKIESLMDWKGLRNYGCPMEPNYHPELDASPFLTDDAASKYRMMVGSLNWLVTLGRWDVHYVTQTMSRYSMLPREGHLEAMQRVFGYLKNHNKVRVVYDVAEPAHSRFTSPKFDWFEYYGECHEELPHDMPIPKGRPVRISGFFDADHAGCLVTRRSTTGLLMCLNNTPVKSYTKRQATVESATYGSEMVAGRISVEFSIDMRYKLRMLGVPIIGSCVLFGDNQSMIVSTTLPSSSLKKKHNAIGYHRVREAVAAGVVDLVYCPSEDNLADILTKPLGPNKFAHLMRGIHFPEFPNNDS